MSEGGFLVPEFIEMPINKWQVFKKRYFPWWLRRIFPVKVDRIDVRKEFMKNMSKDS